MVYVVIAEIDDEKFFGVGFDLKLSPFSGTSERTAVGNTVRNLLDEPTSAILRNLLLKIDVFEKNVTQRWNSLWIKEERRCLRAAALHTAWSELQDTKTKYMPKGWPLVGMRILHGNEYPEEKDNDD